MQLQISLFITAICVMCYCVGTSQRNNQPTTRVSYDSDIIISALAHCTKNYTLHIRQFCSTIYSSCSHAQSQTWKKYFLILIMFSCTKMITLITSLTSHSVKYQFFCSTSSHIQILFLHVIIFTIYYVSDIKVKSVLYCFISLHQKLHIAQQSFSSTMSSSHSNHKHERQNFLIPNFQAQKWSHWSH